MTISQRFNCQKKDSSRIFRGHLKVWISIKKKKNLWRTHPSHFKWENPKRAWPKRVLGRLLDPLNCKYAPLIIALIWFNLHNHDFFYTNTIITLKLWPCDASKQRWEEKQNDKYIWIEETRLLAVRKQRAPFFSFPPELVGTVRRRWRAWRLFTWCPVPKWGWVSRVLRARGCSGLWGVWPRWRWPALSFL